MIQPFLAENHGVISKPVHLTLFCLWDENESRCRKTIVLKATTCFTFFILKYLEISAMLLHGIL